MLKLALKVNSGQVNNLRDSISRAVKRGFFGRFRVDQNYMSFNSFRGLYLPVDVCLCFRLLLKKTRVVSNITEVSY